MRSPYHEERLGELLRLLRPAPEAWVRAAQELPAARASLDDIVARAEADAAYRTVVIADLKAALEQEGIEPSRRVVDELRDRISDARPSTSPSLD
jgi:hypothetical protein